jgi:hypothetical protein
MARPKKKAEAVDGDVVAPGKTGLRPWKPGESGNPSGRPAGAFVLSRALLRNLTDEKADEIARGLIDKAVRGEMSAIQVLLERLEGKAVQRTESMSVSVNVLQDALSELSKEELMELRERMLRRQALPTPADDDEL